MQIEMKMKNQILVKEYCFWIVSCIWLAPDGLLVSKVYDKIPALQKKSNFDISTVINL